ncbi:MAG: fibronectin type III domain-containing protein [Verrucomicrobiaceae bacterium]|nr:fibronectin type III domain-containing protein [Verrucomicrobiaceae bacterium]
MSATTFATTFDPNSVLQLGSARPVIGTAMLGTSFGTIKKLDIERTGDEQELSDGAGGLRGHIIAKPGVSADFEVFFDATVTPPGLYALFTLPDLSVTVRIMTGIKISYDDGKERGLAFKGQMWDSLIDQPAYRLDTATGDRYLLDIGIPVVTATPGSGQIVLDWPDVTDATSYVVQASSDSGATWTTINSPASSTYTHTVTTGQTRHYRVRAVNADGSGEWSAVVSATAA